jgi:hypothetical protein
LPQSVVTTPIIPVGVVGVAASYSPDSIRYDYAIGELPFLSLTSDSTPYERALAPVRKQQVDQSAAPGDQSLDSWWLRSQTDWSGGAGVKFMEPAENERIQRRFDSSAGVDIWELGQISLLRSTSQVKSFPSTDTARLVKYGTGVQFYMGVGSDIDRYNAGTTTATTGFSGTLAHLLLAGPKVLAISTSGTIYSATNGGTSFSSLWTTSSGATKAWWVKQRLLVAQGQDLFELSLAGGNLDVQTEFYKHPDSSWVWTSAAEAPGALLVAGYGDSGSAIYRFVLDAQGDLPTLSGAITTAELPVGEQILDIISYLGAYVVIATNLGIRVGTVATEGQVTYGPFTYEGATSGGLRPFDRFVFTGVTDAGDGRPGLIRMDLSDLDESGRVPWANDVRAPSGQSGTVTGIVATSASDLALVLTGTTARVYATSSNLESTGFIQSGAVRYGTLELKNFDSIRMEIARPVKGSTSIKVVDRDGTATTVGLADASSNLDQSFSIGYPVTPQQQLAVRLELTRDSSDNTKGPIIQGWQIRALPAVTRAELLRIQLSCFDFERDQYGVLKGYDGSALARWQALRDTVNYGPTVRLQDLNTLETLIVVVEELSFSQIAPPTDGSGFGGVISLTARTV